MGLSSWLLCQPQLVITDCSDDFLYRCVCGCVFCIVYTFLRQLRNFFFLISNIKILLKTQPSTQEMYKKAKTSRNQIAMIQQHRKGNARKNGKTRHHSRRIKKKKDLNSIMDHSRPSTSRIPFPLDTPHQTVWHRPPNNYITMTLEIACPTIQQIYYPLRHHPTNTKQAKDHTPYLISYRTVKYQQRDVLYHVVYARVDTEEEAQNRNTMNTRVTWFSLDGLHPRRNPLRATSLLCIRVQYNNLCYNEP